MLPTNTAQTQILSKQINPIRLVSMIQNQLRKKRRRVLIVFVILLMKSGKVEGSSRVHVKDVGKLNKLDRRNQSKQSVAKNKEELVMARRKAKDTPRIVV